MKQNKEKKIDVDYSNDIVPKEVRKRLLDMFMIMLGFTFFSGSMWAGQKVAEGLELVQYLFNSSTIFKICATMSL